MRMMTKIVGSGVLLLGSTGLQADIIHADDVIVQFSQCVGNDCANGESFGFDGIRLKENNLRIHFDDTSASASFPANDWRIVVNDSSNGGANYFAIEDSTAGRIPFRVEAGAPADSLVVEADGDVGIKTLNPVVDLHIVEGNTPTVRLEQNGSSGFTAQTWDMAGNESNFFIRDVTNGSQLPFRIQPGADTDSLYIANDNDIGMGTNSPASSLHVRRTDGTAQLLIEEGSSTVAARTLLKMSNAGNTKFSLENTDAGTEWAFTNQGGALRVSRQGSGAVELEMFNNGNMTIAGNLTQLSDVNAKTAITEVDSEEVLRLVAELPVTRWEYKKARGESHIGPMAQDFYAAFGLGGTDIGISSVDTAGVALVAIQALVKKNEALELAIQELKSENEALVASQYAKLDKVDQLEEMVIQLMQAKENTRVLTSAK